MITSTSMATSNNIFLFLAYSLVWIVFMLYAWRLSVRQSRLAREMEDLQKKLTSRDESRTAKV
jgi:CcmD family protein